MNESLQNDFEKYYQPSEKRHDHLREQLMNSLPKNKYGFASRIAATDWASMTKASRARLTLAFRSIAAMAAVFAIVLSVMFLVNTSGPEATHSAWANAFHNTFGLHSAHFTVTTPSENNTVVAKVWWRDPDNFRIEMGDDLVLTGNEDVRCVLNAKTNLLTLNDPGGIGIEMFFLGELGQKFASDYSVTRKLIRDSNIISSERIIYKGEDCLKVMAGKDDRQYEYIIDNQKDPIIYQIEVYNRSDKPRLLYRTEVLEANKSFPDNMFTIDSKDKEIRDCRTIK